MDCESASLNNCSCSAYAYDSEECTLWSGDLLNLQQLSDSDSNAGDFHLKLADFEQNRRGKKKGMLILVVVGHKTYKMAIDSVKLNVIYFLLQFQAASRSYGSLLH